MFLYEVVSIEISGQPERMDVASHLSSSPLRRPRLLNQLDITRGSPPVVAAKFLHPC